MVCGEGQSLPLSKQHRVQRRRASGGGGFMLGKLGKLPPNQWWSKSLSISRANAGELKPRDTAAVLEDNRGSSCNICLEQTKTGRISAGFNAPWLCSLVVFVYWEKLKENMACAKVWAPFHTIHWFIVRSQVWTPPGVPPHLSGWWDVHRLIWGSEKI